MTASGVANPLSSAAITTLDSSRRIGARLTDRGLITAAELEKALRASRELHLEMGDALIRMGYLTEDQVAAITAEEYSLPYVFPSADSIDRALVALFPPDLLVRYRAVPLTKEESKVTLVTSELPTLGCPQPFEIACGSRVTFSFTSRRRLNQALRVLVGVGPDQGAPEDRLERDDPSAVGLFFGHLVRAASEGAVEIRFEPSDGAVVIRYKIGAAYEERGRQPMSMLLPLIARARVLIGVCKNANTYDLLGTLTLPLGGRETTLTIGITPSRLGDAVSLRFHRTGSSASRPPVRPGEPVEPSPAAPATTDEPIDMPSLLLFTKDAGGSDLHLSSGAVPMIRVHGEMRKLTLPSGGEAPPLAADAIRGLVLELLTDAQKSRLEAEKELDFSLSIGKDTRFRGNVFYQDRGLGAVFRVIPTQIRTCEELGLPPVIKSLAELEKGLVLCTGPTGSGKSTTLAALVDLINSTRRGHILTIEDPIEFVHRPKMCMVNQREVGPNTQSFSRALRSALREDPDVILVGEMRDLETIALAITAAETGHLVFGTLHTSSAAKTVDRIINVFPAGEQAQIRAMLADSLEAVIAQVLVSKRGGKGRVAAQEILMASTGVRSLIREGKTYQIPSAIQTGGKYGMQSLEQTLSKLSLSGAIDPGEAERQLAALGLGREDAAAEKLQAVSGMAPTRVIAPPSMGSRPLSRNP